MTKPPQLLHTEIIARSRLFRIERLDLRFSNGTEVVYERLCGSIDGAVIIVPLRDDGHVLLVREYAAGVGRYELGLPKGRIEPGESPTEAADRELQEEVGHGARRLEILGQLTLAPAYMQHATRIVLARDLYPATRAGDEPEPPEVVPWPLDDLEGLVARDDVTEARTIAALYMTQARLRR